MEPGRRHHPITVNADDALPVGQPSPPHVLIRDAENSASGPRGSLPSWRRTSGTADVRRHTGSRRLPNPCVRREELGMALAPIRDVQVTFQNKVLSSNISVTNTSQRPGNNQQGGQRHHDQSRFRWTSPRYNNNFARQQPQDSRFRWTSPRYNNPLAPHHQQQRPARPQEPPRLYFYRTPPPQRRTIVLARGNFQPEEGRQVQGGLQKNNGRKPATTK